MSLVAWHSGGSNRRRPRRSLWTYFNMSGHHTVSEGATVWGVGYGVWTPLSVPAKTWKKASHEWPPRGVSEGNHFDVFYIIWSEYGLFCTNTSP